MQRRKGTHPSRDGRTAGFTLRLEVDLLALYARIARRASIMDMRRGGSGGVSAQDVMRHQLRKLKKRLDKRAATTTRGENDKD